MGMNKIFAIMLAALAATTGAYAQNVKKYTTARDGALWEESTIRLQAKAGGEAALRADAGAAGPALRAWGTTFNELDWDAFNLLDRSTQDEVMRRLFAPDGDLRFTRGRISMNCNDYGRSWYSCDEVPGDFELRYFNIDRDKTSIIPLVRAAQRYNPGLTFWTSPWSPPSWMKINHDYPVVSSKYNNLSPEADYLLFGNAEDVDEDEMKFLGERDGQFPRRPFTQDYMIQDPRYLEAYARFFCRFIDEYAAQGVPIDMVVYQNEAYSYTPYPGCAWTAEGTIRFNRDYLAPALKRHHPDVKLYIGTFNTNRQDHVERVLADEGLRACISGAAFQWEGREILPAIREQYPDLHYICSESECGNGDMDWKAAEHTLFLIADNMGKGCDEWYNWNFILTDHGESPWGWRQNALLQVDSRTRELRYTPEYYAVKHFSRLIPAGSRVTGYQAPAESRNALTIAFATPDGGTVVVAGNFGDTDSDVSVDLGRRRLSDTLPPHSFASYVVRL